MQSKEERNAQQREWYKRPGVAEKSRARCRAYTKAHPQQKVEETRRWRRKYPNRTLWLNAKSRAKKKGLKFSITPEDFTLPELCPVFGTPLIYGATKLGPQSPSLDRIDNSKGYVPGNVFVISWRANALKSDGTMQEHQAIVEYMKGTQ